MGTAKRGSPTNSSTKLHTNKGNAVGMPMGKPGGQLMNMTHPTTGGAPPKGGKFTPKGNGQPKAGGFRK